MWTNRTIIEQALAELGMASYVYDIQPELMTSAHDVLRAMIAGWEPHDVSLGYEFASELAEESGIADENIELVYTMLACRLAPRLGKTISAETKSATIVGFNALLTRSASEPGQQQLPSTMPMGAGNRRTFAPAPDLSPIAVTTGKNLKIT
jgi:P22 tail accessory factor